MTNPLYKKHIVSITDLTREELELIVSTAEKLKKSPRSDLLQGKVIASCFFEASTRTRLSFETAVQRLGGTFIGFADGGNTSLAKKGETLADSVQVIASYTDAFVMRHPQEGAARLAAEFSTVPVINGGDGSNQHPTQTLLDLFSIYESQGTLDGLKVAFCGDLKYGRTVHSLAQALCQFGAEFTFLAPDALTMPDFLLHDFEEAGIKFRHADSFEEIVHEADILYMTRVQKERFDETEYKHIASRFILTSEHLLEAKPNLRILHPLPRVDEITVDVDRTPYAYYFQQAENGVYAREALLALVLNESI
ncbi:aspartate carbamoyltransferase [Sansalvadorimonas sp. 2012CJ34-2]|uniref:Aspartate carbamoyltransferase n=1 Tax=Parendozoicomonas callyspongiae TaxID=2942213 RepID=A0ABT0PI91_9GAMM|nr:aspartate carbamoyltransferase [Sansalvadorimonas sp. 2012CJ34-2]MCL6270208.1 aspartate carbamoyltransferase [Sansalvadorimonas sp. 2012CJ34-2]